MSQMPEPVLNRQNNIVPSAERFGPTDNQTFAHHVQTLYKLAVPNENIYHALAATDLPVDNLVETFHAAGKEIDLWLEYANIAIFALELDVREGMSIKNVSEMDVLIHKFVPNVELLRELSDNILKKLEAPEEENRRKEFSNAIERISNDWSEAKSFFQRVKKEMSESKQRRELLDTMDQILASIEELNTNIFEYQEQRHMSGGGDNGSAEIFPLQEPSSRSIPLTSVSGVSNSEFSSRADVALMQLDSRLEPLSARIEYLRSRLSAPNAPSDPTGALAKKSKLLTSRWDVLKQEMESLREELKEDRWMTVFKQVSVQANQMMDSLERSVRQCRDFISRATDPAESPLPLKQLQSRGISIPPSRYNQQKSQQSQPLIKSPVAINAKNFQRLYKNFDAKRKYYLPAVTKMLTMIGTGINNEMTRDWDAIKKYKTMKERWDTILGGVTEVQRDMPTLETMIDVIQSNSPPSSKPSSIASSPPISPNMRPVGHVFSPESRSSSPYRGSFSPVEHEHGLSPSRNNTKSPSLRSKSPSPALNPHGGTRSPLGSRQGHLAQNGPSPPPFVERSRHGYQPSYNQPPYSPTYNNHNGSRYGSISPQPVYDRYNGYSKSHSRSNSPIRAPSVAATRRPMSPGHASAIPRPVTSMGIASRTSSQQGMRSLLPKATTPTPGMSRLSAITTPPPRQGPLRARTPSSVTSDASRPISPEDEYDDDDEIRSLSPESETLQKMKVKDHPPYIPIKNDPLDAEVAKIVNSSPISVKVERAPGGKGRYHFGNDYSATGRKVYMCRLVNYSSTGRNKVSVRVGGGWQDLDMFLLEHGLLKDIGVRSLY